ncbi:hypothetical protein DRE_03020 [Drechslerella stenobrocha 248]|uniref:UBA domain-containing protein n=1 Tax=Drechslerella stenobrocha 248 TaxID=1043628 RepID=W7IFC3_9PEZI|nr:hypothetical protein DRE_03020 [Drechslerella stenobrocha 248]
MASQSFSDALAQVMELGIPQDAAEECLKKNGNDVERAVNYYFNGDLENDRNSNRWDDTLWGQDRDGPVQGPSSLNYLVQAADTLIDPVGAKSRPPSPTRKFQIEPHDGDDADLQQAIKASIQDSQRSQLSYTGPQTTGTVGYTGSSNFKPADSSTHYDTSTWALTVSGPTDTNTVEIFLDPSPSERKRTPDQPAFLRPSTGSGSLGPLLTILHSIPASRETLLQRDNILENYGENDHWWSGHVIQLPRVVVEDDPDPIPSEAFEVIRESQRLMAFLTGTDRAYGTAESLGSIPSIFDPNSGTIVTKYFQALRDSLEIIYDKPGARTPLQSKAVRVSPGMEPNFQVFEVADLTISSSMIEQGGSLYDALDALFWEDGLDGTDGTETYAEYLGDVFTLQLRVEDNEHRPCGIQIPAVMHLDRYTEKFKGEMTKMRKEKVVIQSQIDALMEKEQMIRLYSPMSQPTRNLDMVKVLNATKKYFEQSSNPNLLITEGDVAAEERVKRCSEAAKQLAEIETRIQQKIAGLKAQRDALRDKLDNLKAIFTSPTNTLEDTPPLTKHILRGVSTERGVTYTRRMKVVPQINLEAEGEPTESTTINEWWSMKYHTSQMAFSDEQYGSFEIKTVPEELVLRSAQFEGQGHVILVYGKEDIYQREINDVADLPEPLKRFVDQDNKFFAAEIEEAASKPQANKKRPYDDWSTDTNSYGREYLKQWQTGTVNSSRAATPGDSRRNSFDSARNIDLSEDGLKAIPEPPSPPAPPNTTISSSGGPSVHFAIDTDHKSFHGAYGRNHETMAIDAPRLTAPVADADSDDEMAYGSQHIEFASDGTLQAGPMPVPPPPPPPPPPMFRRSLSPPGPKTPRFDLEE